MCVTKVLLLSLMNILVTSVTIKSSGGNVLVCPEGKYNAYMENLANGRTNSRRRRRRKFTLTCVDCGAGRFMDAPDHVYFACKGCPSGKYQPDEGMTSCLGTVCPAGKFGPIAQKTLSGVKCIDCQVGKYTSIAGLGPECVSCEPGRYQADTGGINCDGSLCIAGKFGPVMMSHRADATCNDCSVGKFSNKSGNEYCSLCPNGQYQTMEGQTSCIEQPSCKGMSEYFNKNVFACTLTNENFSWLTPLGICFTILQFLFGCCAGYCIVFIHCIITFALTLHYGRGDYTGAHSDSTIWGITIYYIISILWSMGMVFKSTRTRKIGDEMRCFPWS